ncbi:hypothetical protein V1511DRAFT_493290 [Dipodascopsis uninucleata]
MSDAERQSTESLSETFTNSSLTPLSYLNSSLPHYHPPDNSLSKLHTEAVSLLSTLDQATQELIAKLERIVTEMLGSSNRLRYEVELLSGDVETLDASITNELEPKVIEELASKSPAMERLEMLELVRKRLVEVLKTFEEAKQLDEDIRKSLAPSGGSIVVSDTESKLRELLSQGKFKLANDQVERLQALIQVWKGTLEYSQKVEFVNGMRNLVQDIITRSENGTGSVSRGAALSIGYDSGASTPATGGRSPVPQVSALFDRAVPSEYNVRASAEFLKQEAKEGYLGFLESLKKMRQS